MEMNCIIYQIAMVSSILGQFNNAKSTTKHTLRLDAQGREIDEHGNVIQKKDEVSQIKTISANIAQLNAQKKKENIYLAHRSAENKVDTTDLILDERLPSRKREIKAKKALHFVEPGKYVQEANKIKEKEERKIIAGYASGRKNLQNHQTEQEAESVPDEDSVSAGSITSSSGKFTLPLWPETSVPTMEWWDEAFLPKQKRDQRKISKAAQEKDDFEYLSITNNKTYQLIQHPIPVKPLTVEKVVQNLPMYLTKKERSLEKQLVKNESARREIR